MTTPIPYDDLRPDLWVTIREAGYRKNETEHTQGISFGGELAKGEGEEEAGQKAWEAEQERQSVAAAIVFIDSAW